MVARLRERIQEDARRHGGTLLREAAIAWEGYPAGLSGRSRLRDLPPRHAASRSFLRA